MVRKLSYLLTVLAACCGSSLLANAEPSWKETKSNPTNSDLLAEGSAPPAKPSANFAKKTASMSAAKSTNSKASAGAKESSGKPTKTQSSTEKLNTAKPAKTTRDEFELARLDFVDTPETIELKRSLATKIRFCDELILGSAVRHMVVAAWSREEKQIANEALEKACTLAPGLMKRALQYGPITVYRAGESTHRFALAYPPYINSPNTELVLASKFFEEPEPGIYAFEKMYPRRLWTCIHELSHLADAAHKISGSPEWLKLLPSLLADQRLAYKMGEVSAYICWTKGVPSRYTSTNEREALAEYATALALIKGKTSINADVEAYIKKNILCDPNATDSSVPLTFEAYNFFARKNASIEDLQKSVDLFNKALAIDPQYLHAQYGRQLAEMRLEALRKSQTK